MITLRREPWSWPGLLAIALFLLACAILVSRWEYGADDVLFVRQYSQLHENGDVTVDWGRVAADWHGPWAGNPHLDFYRPVVSTSLALDFALFGFAPGASAVLNVAVHLASALLLLLLARLVLPDRRSALLAAAFFACTPLAHENLAWAVGRCGLTTLFGVAAAYLFVRGWHRGRRGTRLHAGPLLCTLLNLATMESAVAWTLFPILCLLLLWIFDPEQERRGPRGLALLALPYVLVVPLYLLWRWISLGAVLSASPVPLHPQTVGAWLLAPIELLYESLAPTDASWISAPMRVRLWQWLCLLPVALGLLAPLWFPDPRSVRYRHALALLLVFWFASRLPNLELRVGEGLEASRAAYYSYPALALLLGLLLATSRYAFGLGLLAAFFMGAQLWHRLDARIEQAQHGRTVLERLGQEARKSEQPLPFVNQVNGVRGAPAIHAGETALALAPPFVPERIHAIGLHGLIAGTPNETGAAAAIAAAAGDPFWCKLVRGRVVCERVDAAPFARPLPESGLSLRLGAELAFEFVEDSDAAGELLLLVVGGPEPLRVSLPRNRRLQAWPEAARSGLERWRRLLGPGAPFAALVERRVRRDDPATATARSGVRFARLP